jgi:hypothetical protein
MSVKFWSLQAGRSHEPFLSFCDEALSIGWFRGCGRCATCGAGPAEWEGIA